MSYRIVGQPTPRTDALGRVTGEACYTSDVLLPGTLWAKVLRSPHSHARIAHIDATRAERHAGVHAVLTGDDVRGILYGRRYRDLSVLAQERVRFVGEPVAAVAAVDRETALAALELIALDYEELPAVFDPLSALAEGAPLIHPEVNSYPGLPEPLEPLSNAFVEDLAENGDVDAAFAHSEVIVENTFTVARVHQAFLEPHSCLVQVQDDGRVEVWSSSKAPHTMKQSLANAFGIPKERIRVNPVFIGGDFGGKGGALYEPLCYLLSLRSRRPVKMVMEYQEELTAGAPRHAVVFKMKTGVKRDGTLVAHRMDALFDSGAYGGTRPGANFKGACHAGGWYRIPNVRQSVKRVYTNNLPGGQMRAPGEPQTFFATESQMDCVARRLGMDPLEFRRKNLIQDGESTSTGEQFQEIKARETLEAAVKAAVYQSPKAANVGRGVAMGNRVPGGGATSLTVELTPDGAVILHTAALEQGSGTYTTLRQIVAEELSLDPAEIQIKTLDTDSSPFDSGIGGSRGTRIHSAAAFQAAREAKEELLDLAEELLGWSRNETNLAGEEIVQAKTKERKGRAELLILAGRSIVRRAINQDTSVSPVTAFVAQVAEVSVDRETGQLKLLRLTTAHDTGTIMNPVGHQGQIDGGVIQGVGYGLMEELSVQEGRVGTAHFGDYKIPTAKDIPPLDTVILEGASGVGPYRIKGIGENPITPVAAAIANAVEDAVGVRIHDLPVTAEKVYRALEKK